MAHVYIPFRPHFKEPMLSGIKTCTARTKAMGKEGDTFTAFGQEFNLITVGKVQLSTVAALWKQEGCTSEEHFKEIWRSIHPIKGYIPEQEVYLHHFMMVPHGSR